MMLAMTAMAYAQTDTMKGADDMAQQAENQMAKKEMKDDMKGHDTMHKDGMMKDEMKGHDAMHKDGMMKDDMKDDTMKKHKKAKGNK